MTEVATISRGAVLDSRYRLQRLLGAGGMASVWLATDDALGRAVAVKIISDTLACDETWVRRFEREARTLAGLNHPNIVRIFDFGVDRGRPFLVMEYLAQTLADGVEEGSRGDPEQIARELLSALAHMHAAGLIHRDVKPSNVLLANDGSPRLTDFGIAYTAHTTRLTSTGMVIGSVRYIAPEVLAGEPATARSDLFSLGRLLDELCSYRPGSARLVSLVRALTQTDPERRPRSADEALERLGAPDSSPSRASDGPPRTHGALAAATAAHSVRRHTTRLLARGRERATRAITRGAQLPGATATRILPAAHARADARARAARRSPAARPGTPRASSPVSLRSRRRRALAVRALAALALVTLLVVLIISTTGGRSSAPAPAHAAHASGVTPARSAGAPAPSARGSLQQRLDAIATRISLAAGR